MSTSSTNKNTPIGLLPISKAAKNLVLFARHDFIKAGFDILKELGDNSLKEKKYLKQAVYTKFITGKGVSITYTASSKLRQHEQEYDRSVYELRQGIEERIFLAGKNAIRPELEEFQKNLLQIQSSILWVDEIMKNINGMGRQEGASPIEAMITDFYDNVLELNMDTEILNTENVNPEHLKQYVAFVQGQYLKLVQLCTDFLNSEPVQRVVTKRGKQETEGTLTEMFSDKSKLIAICERLCQKEYVEKIKEGRYRWVTKAEGETPASIGAFSGWLIKNKNKLFIDGKGFKNTQHCGRALCSYFEIAVDMNSENRNKFQQFQPKRAANAGIEQFKFLDSLI